ncbi:hypothetical protein [Sulfitobacter pontiacus]|uniref:hypothetical protein n=1 Tax=Sulfitobacter pontiacus TaxID=60137 RepID=UPI0015E024ED|nr:hypothetical protein [Sulfitobacter pontiacus]QLL42406.1 hypothetical protein G6548_07670 [Sulfitobacter pontiacus]
MSDHLTPLEVCERLIGKLPVIEQITGRKPKGAYAWRRPAQGRRSGDMPADVNRTLLKYAKRHGIPLTPAHLIWGASRSEIDALLQGMARRSVAAE